METCSLNSSFVKSLNFENDKNITIFQLSTFASKFSIQEAVPSLEKKIKGRRFF